MTTIVLDTNPDLETVSVTLETTGDDELLRMFVLDVLQHDVAEQVTSIVKMLNNTGCIGWRVFWPHDFTEAEVIGQLTSLVHGGDVRMFREDVQTGNLEPISSPGIDVPALYDSLWFGCTKQGHDKWSTWDPPVSE